MKSSHRPLTQNRDWESIYGVTLVLSRSLAADFDCPSLRNTYPWRNAHNFTTVQDTVKTCNARSDKTTVKVSNRDVRFSPRRHLAAKTTSRSTLAGLKSPETRERCERDGNVRWTLWGNLLGLLIGDVRFRPLSGVVHESASSLPSKCWKVATGAWYAKHVNKMLIEKMISGYRLVTSDFVR